MFGDDGGVFGPFKIVWLTPGPVLVSSVLQTLQSLPDSSRRKFKSPLLCEAAFPQQNHFSERRSLLAGCFHS